METVAFPVVMIEQRAFIIDQGFVGIVGKANRGPPLRRLISEIDLQIFGKSRADNAQANGEEKPYCRFEIHLG
jgi:hypothetical protein